MSNRPDLPALLVDPATVPVEHAPSRIATSSSTASSTWTSSGNIAVEQTASAIAGTVSNSTPVRRAASEHTPTAYRPGTRGQASGQQVSVRPYLSTEQLAEVTPWTVQAINSMRKRGILRAGVHFFQPGGRGGQVLYKWVAIVAFIEGGETKQGDVVNAGRPGRNGLDVERAEEELRRLLS